MPVVMAAVPPDERPRERLAVYGVESMSARELLALVLRNGTAGMSALDLADELLAEFGSLNVLARARPEELARRPGIGPAKAAALVAAFGLARKIERTPASRASLRSARTSLESPFVSSRDYVESGCSCSSATAGTGSATVRPCPRAPWTVRSCLCARSSTLSCATTDGHSPWRTTTPTVTPSRATPTGERR